MAMPTEACANVVRKRSSLSRGGSVTTVFRWSPRFTPRVDGDGGCKCAPLAARRSRAPGVRFLCDVDRDQSIVLHDGLWTALDADLHRRWQ
jgi:hypothetical protein